MIAAADNSSNTTFDANETPEVYSLSGFEYASRLPAIDRAERRCEKRLATVDIDFESPTICYPSGRYRLDFRPSQLSS